MALRELLATPAVAVTLGMLVGLALMAPLLFASRFAFGDKPDLALYASMGASMGGILVGAGILFGYRALARDGFIWFGPSVIVGFVVGLMFSAIVMLRRLSRSKEETRS